MKNNLNKSLMLLICQAVVVLSLLICIVVSINPQWLKVIICTVLTLAQVGLCVLDIVSFKKVLNSYKPKESKK